MHKRKAAISRLPRNLDNFATVSRRILRTGPWKNVGPNYNDQFLQFYVRIDILCFVCFLSGLFFVSLNFVFHYVFVCVCIAWRGHPQNDLYCVGWDVKTYSLIHLYYSVASFFCWFLALLPAHLVNVLFTRHSKTDI